MILHSKAFFYLIFEGIALGTQPLISFNTGAGLKEHVTKFRNLAFIITLLIAVIGVITLYRIPEIIVYMFAGDNRALQPEAIKGMSLYFWGLPFEDLLLVGSTYFQAINMPKEASLLTGGKLLLISIAIFVLTYSIGVNGVWLALPICSAALTLWMIFRLRMLSITSQN
ncbi:hypothetical protein GLP28_07945 [Photobacterium carnosum]|nr:hypothetical protein [Photobacterium carnosum]MCF2161812.1 hypothetical protein [Photobacterium carnosum]